MNCLIDILDVIQEFTKKPLNHAKRQYYYKISSSWIHTNIYVNQPGSIKQEINKFKNNDTVIKYYDKKYKGNNIRH